MDIFKDSDSEVTTVESSTLLTDRQTLDTGEGDNKDEASADTSVAKRPRRCKNKPTTELHYPKSLR